MPFPRMISDNLGALAQYVLEPPTFSELNDDGVFSLEACKVVEDLLLSDLSKRLKGYYVPQDHGRGSDPNNRWRTVSCLQKAIRFGDVEMAKFAASAAYDMDPKYLMRRLMVIAIEDVCCGNLYATLVTMAVGGSLAWRKAVDERRLFIFLAEMMASSPGDRTATELILLADFDKVHDKKALATKSNEELAERLSDDNSLTQAMILYWTMAGSHKFHGMNMPESNDRPARGLSAHMAKSGMSRAMLYLASKVVSRVGESLWISLPIIEQWLKATPKMTVVSVDMPETPKVGKLLGAAYDMHTREGKIAITRFAKQNQAVFGPFQDECTGLNRDLLMYFGVFLAEGGRLSSKVVYGQSLQLYEDIEVAELGFPGLSADLSKPFMELLTSKIPELNAVRTQVLTSKFQQKAKHA